MFRSLFTKFILVMTALMVGLVFMIVAPIAILGALLINMMLTGTVFALQLLRPKTQPLPPSGPVSHAGA